MSHEKKRQLRVLAMLLLGALWLGLVGCGGPGLTEREPPIDEAPIVKDPTTDDPPLNVFAEDDFYRRLPEPEEPWWGPLSQLWLPPLGDDAAAGEDGRYYTLELYASPLHRERRGKLAVYVEDAEEKLAPFGGKLVLVYGKLVATGAESRVGELLYIGSIRVVDASRIGCDERRIPQAEREASIVMYGDCNHYLKRPQPEELWQGTLLAGYRGDDAPLPDRRDYYYFLETEEGQLALGGDVRPELEALVGQRVTVYGKLLSTGDLIGPEVMVVPNRIRANGPAS